MTVPLPGPCQCPGTPHEADEVYLLPKLGFEGGSAATVVIRRFVGQDDPDGLDGPLIDAFLRHQVSGWNLLGEDGPLPYDPDLLLSDFTAARAVGEKADDLYSEALLAPLQAAASTSSPGGPTAPSTSARTRSGSTRRKR